MTDQLSRFLSWFVKHEEMKESLHKYRSWSSFFFTTLRMIHLIFRDEATCWCIFFTSIVHLMSMSRQIHLCRFIKTVGAFIRCVGIGGRCFCQSIINYHRSGRVDIERRFQYHVWSTSLARELELQYPPSYYLSHILTSGNTCSLYPIQIYICISVYKKI